MTDELAKHVSWSAGVDVDEAMSAVRRRRLLWLTAHWLLRPVGYLELTDVYKIGFATLPPLFEILGYTIEHATANDIRELTRHSHRGEPPAVINSLWREGHHCFVAKSGKRIVAYNWIAFGSVQEEEYRYEPDSNHAICIDAYTYPEHRGKKLHYLLLLTMLHFAAASGKSMAYTGASLFNVVSWKTHVRMGWRRAFTFCWFRPYITLNRRPWPLCSERYPLRLNWNHHTWFVAEGV
jgi:hypothetical protein